MKLFNNWAKDLTFTLLAMFIGASTIFFEINDYYSLGSGVILMLILIAAIKATWRLGGYLLSRSDWSYPIGLLVLFNGLIFIIIYVA